MSPRPGLNLGVWRTKLVDDADQEFFLSGLKYGFDIVDSDVQVGDGKSSVCQARIPKLLSNQAASSP